ncbi:MAG TPA: glycosyltransferase [Dehalococcoidia bacterium]|nr:glycosyltransferase [Dehalococcoidia bacterium]
MRIDVLIPTYRRPAALAVTLTSLCAQEQADLRLVISDQDEAANAIDAPEVQAATRVLRAHGIEVDWHKHLPRRGMAEQRQFLLDEARAPWALFLDDDVILERWAIGVLASVLARERCGFTGMPLVGLSYADDVREHEQDVAFWDGPVAPEDVRPGSPAWDRYRLHNAANALHVQRRLRITPASPRAYRIAWAGGCVLYDVAKLRACGGFEFWRELPDEHCGEDALAQLRVMRAYGGCGVLPSGAYHQELPTTLPNRGANAPQLLDLEHAGRAPAAVP